MATMTSCWRCQGCLSWNFEEWYCANCGWRENVPGNPPITVNPNRCYTPGRCEMCGKSAMRGRTLCLGCWKKERLA
jgi:hypothetical protein